MDRMQMKLWAYARILVSFKFGNPYVERETCLKANLDLVRLYKRMVFEFGVRWRW